MSDTGSPTKLNSEKAMKPTTSITTMPWSSRRRTKAIKRLLDGDPLHHELVVRAMHAAHVRAHRPGNHLEVQRDVAHVGLVDAARLDGERRALRRIDLGLQLVDVLVHLRVRVLAQVVVAVGR